MLSDLPARVQNEPNLLYIIGLYLLNKPKSDFTKTAHIYADCKDDFIKYAPDFWQLYDPAFKKAVISRILRQLGCTKDAINSKGAFTINREILNQQMAAVT